MERGGLKFISSQLVESAFQFGGYVFENQVSFDACSAPLWLKSVWKIFNRLMDVEKQVRSNTFSYLWRLRGVA